jgi:hypothetical protein
MILRIFLPDRGRKQIILGIIIDHSLGEDFVFARISRSMLKPVIHKGGKLIHIQIYVRHILKFYIINTIKTFNYTVDQIICVNSHGVPFMPWFLVP